MADDYRDPMLHRIATRLSGQSGHDCTKCYKSIPSGTEVEVFGVLYHKKCAPKSARKPK